MSTVRIQVRNRTKTGLPEDVITNTWFFDGSGDLVDPDNPAGAVANAAIGELDDFYQAVAGGFSSNLEDLWYWTAYDMSDPMPRTPCADGTFAAPVSQVQGADLPSEIAVCLSFHGEYISGQKKARRRGRIFLGPLAQSSMEIVGNIPRVKATYRTTIANAANDLRASNEVVQSWAVYSPTTDLTSELDEATNDVVGGWVDNAFDVQRSRGQAPSARTTFNGG